MKTYTAQELADNLQQQGDTKINKRTITYYSQIGLMPDLEIVKKRRVFTEIHMDYLRAIRTLAKTGKSLKQIKSEIGEFSIEDIRRISNNFNFYSTSQVAQHETIVVNEQVSLLVNSNFPREKKEELVGIVSDFLKENSINA